MVVYVLICGYTNVDSGTFSTSVIGVFSNYDIAYKAMVNEINSARKDYEGYDTEEEQFVEGDMSWSIWEKDEYASNHCDLIIKEETILDSIAE